jgi:hypothetical protein
MTLYLYVKTHATTGLKYLGKTNRSDPHKYLGSGVYWRRHIEKYGQNFTTEILKECSTNEELKHWGLYYSNLWNIVNAKDGNGRKIWANLKPEFGDGGSLPGKDSYRYGKSHSEETKKKLSEKLTGVKKPDGFGNKISKAQKGKPGRPRTEAEKKMLSKVHKGKIVSEETRQKVSNALRGKPKSEEHRLKIIKNGQAQCKPIMTPAGRFESRNAAALYYNIKPESIGSRIKRNPDKYYYC